jgi:hypothetical protein
VRYRTLELVVKTVEFGDDHQGIDQKEGEIFGGERQVQLQCQKQPWLWQGPLLVSKVKKTWLMNQERELE